MRPHLQLLIGSDNQIAASPPDAVLLDIQMPVVDGFEAIRRIRSDVRHQHLLVIALTAYAMRGDREKALAAGFDEYVTKPIDFEVLLSAIGQKKNGCAGEPKRHLLRASSLTA